MIDFHDLCDPVTATCISEKTIYVIVVSLFDFDGHPHSQYTTLDTEIASLNIHGYTEIFKSLTIQHLTLNIQFSHIIEQSTFELYKMSNHCRRQLQQKTDFIIFFRISWALRISLSFQNFMLASSSHQLNISHSVTFINFALGRRYIRNIIDHGSTCVERRKEKMLDANAMKCVCAGRSSPDYFAFEPAKRPGDRAEYCMGLVGASGVK